MLGAVLAEEIGWQNVVEGNGVGLSVTGLLIVFSALILVSLVIAAIPRMLAGVNAIFPEPASRPVTTKRSSPSRSDDGAKIAAAVGMVLHHRRRQ